MECLSVGVVCGGGPRPYFAHCNSLFADECSFRSACTSVSERVSTNGFNCHILPAQGGAVNIAT
jgi:hypothetical protein